MSRVPISIDAFVDYDKSVQKRIEPFLENFEDVYGGCLCAILDLQRRPGQHALGMVLAIKGVFHQTNEYQLVLRVKVYLQEQNEGGGDPKNAKFEAETEIRPEIPFGGEFNEKSFGDRGDIAADILAAIQAALGARLEKFKNRLAELKSAVYEAEKAQAHYHGFG